MASITFRRGVAADAAVLAAFAARTFAETFGAENRPEDMRAHLARSYGVAQQTAELDDHDVVTLLAHRDHALIAYAQVRRHAPPPCVTQELPIQLHRFYVDRPAHGSGIAAQLMAAAKATARALGGRHLWLTVWDRNPRAIAFYGKMGFADVGTADFYLGPERQTDRVLVGRLDS